MEYPLGFNNVWKSFKRGEKATLLRDVIPLILDRLTKKESPTVDKTFWALKNLSFRVKKGEMLGIIGPNGAGKTTILNLIAGIMRPNKGDITRRGRISCLIIAGAGFHPQFTGRENIYLNGSIMGMSKKEISRKFDSIVEFAGYGFHDYERFIDTPVKRYSSGMLVRLGFAVAAHLEPDILLVDEVLAVGDIAFQQKCLEYMNELTKSDVTVVMVSHNMSHIVNYCNQAILVKGGKIAVEGEPSKVVSVLERGLSKKMSWVAAGNVPNSRPLGGTILSNVKFDSGRRMENELNLYYGESIEVSFDYNCLKYPLDDVTFSLVVYRREDGCRCYGLLSHIYGCYPKRKEGHIKLIVKDHNLLPGDYVFDIEIKSLKGNRVLAIHREREVLVTPADKYLSRELCGIYQPASISWNIH